MVNKIIIEFNLSRTFLLGNKYIRLLSHLFNNLLPSYNILII